MENPILKKIEHGDFSDFNGGKLFVKIPLTLELINIVLAQLPIPSILDVKIESIQHRVGEIKIKVGGGKPLTITKRIKIEIEKTIKCPELELRLKIIQGFGRVALEAIRIINRVLKNNTIDITENIISLKVRKIADYSILGKITGAQITGGVNKLFLELTIKL